MQLVVHGWHVDRKSLTACGIGWVYGRHAEGKKPLKMVDGFTCKGVTCKRCLKSRNLRRDGETKIISCFWRDCDEKVEVSLWADEVVLCKEHSKRLADWIGLARKGRTECS